MWHNFIILLLWSLVSAFVVSETTICSNGVSSCDQWLAGTIYLKNEERTVFNTVKNISGRDAMSHDPGQQGLEVKISKSPVTKGFGLEYIRDVFTDFHEYVNVYQYTDFGNIGDTPGEFCYKPNTLVDDCSSLGKNRTPDGTPLPYYAGKCCFCQRGGVISYTEPNPRKRHPSCGAFNMVRVLDTFMEKSCFDIQGPWYNAYKILPPKIRWNITLDLSWSEVKDPESTFTTESRNEEAKCLAENNQTDLAYRDCSVRRRQFASTSHAHIVLNDTTRSVYEENNKIFVDATFDVSNGDDYTDFTKYILFLPSYNTTYPEDPKPCLTKECLDDAVMLDEKYFSYSGIECNKVGTSPRSWGNPEIADFCELSPGSCMNNQLADFKYVDRVRIKKGKKPKYQLKEGMTLGVMNGLEVMHGTLDVHTTVLNFRLPKTNLSWLVTSSPGYFLYIDVPWAAMCEGLTSSGCMFNAYVTNSGTESAMFKVQIPFCNSNNEIFRQMTPPSEMIRRIDAQKSEVMSTTLRPMSILSQEYICVAILRDAEGRALDQRTFNFTTRDVERRWKSNSDFRFPPKVEIVHHQKNGNYWFGNIFGSDPTKCSCKPANILCLILNVYTCMDVVKKIVVAVSVFVVGIATTAIMFKPMMGIAKSMLKCCLRKRRYSKHLTYISTDSNILDDTRLRQTQSPTYLQSANFGDTITLQIPKSLLPK